MANKQVNSRTIGIRVSVPTTLDVSLSKVETSLIVTHLVKKFTSSLPERIMFKKDNSGGTIRVEGKKIRIRFQPWTVTIDGGHELTFEPFNRELRHQRKTLFEKEWTTAQQNPDVWFTWQSVEYFNRIFNARLVAMTETERVLALNESAADLTSKPFEYVFPCHLLEKIGPTHILYRWFLANCTGDQPKLRRKALVLFSEKRCLGKTEFAYDLVSRQKELVLKIRGGCFVKENFANQSQAKLLLLDGVTWDAEEKQWDSDEEQGDSDEEQRDVSRAEIKALVRGESTNIRGRGFSLVFEHGLPTIITIACRRQYSRMISDPMFNTSCKFVEVRSFLGPPGTEPMDLSKDEVDIAIIDFENDHQNHSQSQMQAIEEVEEEEDEQRQAQQQPHPPSPDDKSNNSERFKSSIKQETGSNNYLKCQEEDRQAILTKISELNAEVERLKRLYERAPSVTINNVFSVTKGSLEE